MKCTIHKTAEGPRVPMLHGTSPTEVCIECGWWRRTLHVNGPWESPDELERELQAEGGYGD